MKFAILLALAALVSCGGGSDPMPIAQCNGAPKAAVVYVGESPPAQFAEIPNACVYTTDAAGLEATVARAKGDASVPRVYVISNGTTAALDYMATSPGSVNIASVWFTPPWRGDLAGALVSIYANGGACPVTSNHEGPVVCLPAQVFDLQAAIVQLQL